MSSGSFSFTQIGMHEPQKRLRLTFQSFASRSQFPKRFSPTLSGTQPTFWFRATNFSRRSCTRTYQASIAR